MKTTRTTKLVFGKALITLALTSLLSSCTLDSQADTLVAENTETVQEADTTTAKAIKIALLLDTSNSMDGLIEQAKSQLWTLVNELSKAKCGNERPSLQIALYEYGNDRLSRQEGYIRQVLAFSEDLDKVSRELFALSTNGGHEFCGQVIQTSLKQLAWNADGNDLQMIFIAGNEPFNQGPVDYRTAVQVAKNRNIVVNTIYCGSFDEGRNSLWKNGADLANGSYMSIEQDRKTVYIDTPYDDPIAELNQNLNNTYIYYGHQGAEKKIEQAQQDKNAESYGKANSVSRTVTKSKHVYKNSGWDLVDAKKDNKVVISEVAEEELPAEMKGMSAAQKTAYVDKKEKEREEIKAKISDLSVKREAYIKEKQKASGTTEKSLDNAMIGAIKQQAKTKQLVFTE